jgi:DUF1680 family protein
MLLLAGEAKYADLMELTLYNAVLPGLGLDGRHYFYVNPLTDDGGHRRQPWFECACCPPNIARTIASIGGYFSTVSGATIALHLYGQGTAAIPLPDGRTVRLRQVTRYPWDGDVAIEVDGAGDFALLLRVPGWCASGVSAAVNGRAAVQDDVRPGTYLRLARRWRSGDAVHLRFPMPVRLIAAHPRLLENTGRVAIMRGPLVYCVEGVDHPQVDLDSLVVPRDATFTIADRPALLGGIVALATTATIEPIAANWGDCLYQTVERVPARHPLAAPASMTAIPYFAWANRDPGPMRIWLRRA